MRKIIIIFVYNKERYCSKFKYLEKSFLKPAGTTGTVSVEDHNPGRGSEQRPQIKWTASCATVAAVLCRPQNKYRGTWSCTCRWEETTTKKQSAEGHVYATKVRKSARTPEIVGRNSLIIVFIYFHFRYRFSGPHRLEPGHSVPASLLACRSCDRGRQKRPAPLPAALERRKWAHGPTLPARARVRRRAVPRGPGPGGWPVCRWSRSGLPPATDAQDLPSPWQHIM